MSGDTLEGTELDLWRGFGIVPRAHEVRIPSSGTVRVLTCGEGPPLLLLHASGLFASSWAVVAPLLAGSAAGNVGAGFRLLMPDLPGHGLSGGADYDRIEPRKQNVALVSAVLDHFDIDRASIAGNSIGGQVGLWAALDIPERVERLVVVGTPAVAFEGYRGGVGTMLLGMALFGRLLVRLPQPRAVERFLLKTAYGREAAARVPRELYELHHGFVKRKAWRDTLSSLMRRVFDGHRPRAEYVLGDDELTRLSLPVICLWGDDDIYGGPDVAKGALRHMPNASLEVVPGGHFPHWNDPEWFAAAVRSFAGITAREEAS